MEQSADERAREQEHLARTLAEVRAQLEAARAGNADRAADLASSASDMWADAAQGIGDLNSTDEFEQLLGLNQFVSPHIVMRKMHALGEARERTLMRMLDSPYFARIDVRFDDDEAEAVYIGRATLKEERSFRILIHDWRTPIASVFYRFGVGPAFYDAPMGRIDCALLLKRQYEIRQSRLKFFFDADVEVSDQFLRQLLAKNTSPTMKAIVETIQREQDEAIRDAKHDLLMIDGAAGSGKTSVALHRVAYLMYRGLSSPLSAEHIVILSPNTLFEQYVAAVLPELGEDEVNTTTFEQLCGEETGHRAVRRNAERLERIYTARGTAERVLRSCAAFKTSAAFVSVLDRFVARLPEMLPYGDIMYGGKVILTREQFAWRVKEAGQTLPLGAALLRVERSIFAIVRERRPERMRALIDRMGAVSAIDIRARARAYSIHESAALKRQVQRVTRIDCLALYRSLMESEALFARMAGEALSPDVKAVLSHTRQALARPVLDYEDALAVSYLRARLEGCADSSIRQVVVDEVQDYGALHFHLLARRYPRARFTMLGDTQQVLCGAVNPGLYEEMAHVWPGRTHALVRLNKSFRCTRQIFEFARQFLAKGTPVMAFNRDGEAPVLYCAADGADCAARIGREAQSLMGQGHQSIALITKTARDAAAWHERLERIVPHTVVTGEGQGMPKGVFLMPLPLSKGLEFDGVMLLDCDRAHYGRPEDRSLLYVACTRALHRLMLCAVGEFSPLIDTGGRGEA